MVSAYVEGVKSDVGTIGQDVTIADAGYIKNVRIGDFCKIEGAARLKNGSINSNQADPVHVGVGVVGDDFIICSGSSVEDGVTFSRCFIGQACRLGHNYSASDSLFFSNCQGENGEACAIFAGPYTVTHHKSTLLIAGMFSFMNAGSGSNQSNHLYKLGPIHHGKMERGAKTASDSYILWPAKVGAFSLVMGRHVNHQDTSDLQDALVRAICRKDNVFMVGDVKQSIYRFRLAEPRLFLEKYADYRARKLSKSKKQNSHCILVTGLIFLAIGILFTAIWHVKFYNV